jgi:hypothetical protein
MKTGIELIADERERQVTSEGWTTAHDDSHDDGELAQAASCYANIAAAVGRGVPVEDIRGFYTDGYDSLLEWPWEESWWKPSEDLVRNLVRAGALIAAELDRLSRQNAEL